MADDSGFMDWHPQTPPPAHNPYQGDYMPGGWPVDLPTPPPPTAGIFMPSRRPSPLDHILPVAKRICAGLGGLAGLGFHAATQLGRCTVDATTTVVTVPTVYIVRKYQQRRREQRPHPNRRQAAPRPRTPPPSQTPLNRAAAREPIPAQQITTPTLPQTPTASFQPQPKPVSPVKEEHPPTDEVLYEIPEFRPHYVLNRRSKNVTPRVQFRRKRPDRVFPAMPRFTPPREPKLVHLPTPEEKSEKPLLECGKLESPYPQLKPIPASPPSPAATITSLESATPSAQLHQGLQTFTEGDTSIDLTTPSKQLQQTLQACTESDTSIETTTPSAQLEQGLQTLAENDTPIDLDPPSAQSRQSFQAFTENDTSIEPTTPNAKLPQGFRAVTESDTESNSLISSIQRSRKRRIHIQDSRATENGETAAFSKRVRTNGLSVDAPHSPTPTIVVQDAPSSENPKAPTPNDSTLLSPPRLKLRRFNTPKSVQRKETLPKTPQSPLSDISSACDCSPGNYHIDALRSPIKSEISSFFDGTPPPNPQQEAHVVRMIMAGGGSPIPASGTLAESESVGETLSSYAMPALEQTAGETSNSDEPVTPETKSEANNDPTPTTTEVIAEMAESVLGLANQDPLLSESHNVTKIVEDGATMQETEISETESSKTPERVNTHKPEAASPIDLTEDKDRSEFSSSASSSLHTPLKQLAELSLDDVYTPDQPTPKATLHSSEKVQRVTRAESKRLAILEEKTHYEIVPLTEEWETKIQTALRHGHGTYKATDFTRVVPLNGHSSRATDQWLNDEVINGYLSLVVAHGKQNDRPTQVPTHHAFVSFFFNNLESRGYDSVKRWASRAKIGGKNLLETEAVFIPVNSGAHWTLCVVSGRNRTIAHYNSLAGNGRRYINIVKSWVSAELGTAYKESEWTFIDAGESPQQTNMDDCGVYTITSARQIMLGLTPMSYSPDMIPLQRRRIVAELVNGALLRSSL
ncbi:hypothetical protein AYL99_09165 [Fonsecaea erecta]|uniref:Ubiquitin-like protease family profile domain-containing protein n=1 Tax=Fonsecaea erecta TaxID=1367422 RepID=A0A178ZBK9_9EURO|nr:hypothetical protein AYL99_09165 [Fonsecaea erecta]OAP57052.1 hypothetical protein AYL99_09165 [Fonsecaea erecta]